MGYYFHLSTVSKRLEKDLTEARGELQRYETIDREVKEMQVEEGRLSSRLSVIQDLLRGTLTYPKFSRISWRCCRRMFGSKACPQPPTGPGTGVTVNAQALSSFAVADWLTNLLSSSFAIPCGWGHHRDRAKRGNFGDLQFHHDVQLPGQS